MAEEAHANEGPSAKAEAPGGTPSTDERFERIRELGSRNPPVVVARTGSGAARRLVVVERVSRTVLGDVPIESLAAAPRVLAKVLHTNLVRVVEVDVNPDAITIVTDFVDGQLWSDFYGPGASIPVPVALRILSDICHALTALRAARAPTGETLPEAHGEVTGSNLVVSLDGTARLLRACRVRAGGSPPETRATDVASVAPEVWAGKPPDARSDVYGMGSLLWAALSGEPLFEGKTREQVAESSRAGDLPAARAPQNEPWAAPLVEVAWRAISADPEKRFANAGVMGAEIRKIAGSKLASIGTVATFVKTAAGAAISARRAALQSSAAYRHASGSQPSLPRAPSQPSLPKAPSQPSFPKAPSQPAPPPSNDVAPVSSGSFLLDSADIEPQSLPSSELSPVSSIDPLPTPPPSKITPLAPPLHNPVPFTKAPSAMPPALPARATASKPPLPGLQGAALASSVATLRPPDPVIESPGHAQDLPPSSPFLLVTPSSPPAPLAPADTHASGTGGAPAEPVPFTFSLFDPASAPPPMDPATMALARGRPTLPSIRVTTLRRNARRRSLMIAAGVLGIAAIAGAAWTLVPRVDDESASGTQTKPTAEPPAAPAAAVTSSPVAAEPAPPPTASVAAAPEAPAPSPPPVASPAPSAAAPAPVPPPAPAAPPPRKHAPTTAEPAAPHKPAPAKPKYSFDPTRI